MVALRQWLRRYKHVAHLVAFLLIIIPSAGLYLAAQQDAISWIWILIAIVVFGNILVVGVD